MRSKINGVSSLSVLTVLLFSLLCPAGLSAKGNHLPVVSQLFKKTISMNEAISISLGSLVTDSDGDELIYKITALPKNGKVILERAAKIPAMGRKKNGLLGIPFGSYILVKYIPNASFIGEDEFLFSVSDRKDEFQSGKIQINVVDPSIFLQSNAPPSVIKGVFEASVGTPISINGLALALDPDGDPMSFDFYKPEFKRSRPPFTGNPWFPLKRGKVYTDEGSFFSYLPAKEGMDSFDYVIDDDHGHSVIGSIEIHNKLADPLVGLEKYLTLFVRIGFKILVILASFLLFLFFATQTSLGRTFQEKIRLPKFFIPKCFSFYQSCAEKIKQHLLFIVLFMFNIAYFYYHFCHVTLPETTSWYSYYATFNFFKNGIIPVDEGIFLQRLLIPFLASLVPSSNPGFCFWVVNWVLMNLTVLSLYSVWNLLSLKKYLMFLAFFWICFSPHGIVIFYNLVPYGSDSLQYFFYAVLLLIILTKKYKWLLILTPVATLGKETCLSVIMIFFIFSFFHNKLHPGKEKVPLFMIFSSLLLGFAVRNIPTYWIASPEHNLTLNTLRMLWFGSLISFWVHFELVIIWLIVQFLAFGGLLLIGLQNFVQAYRNTFVYNALLLFSSFATVVSLLLSGDMERVSAYGSPFIMTLILLLINGLNARFVVLVFVLSLPLLHLYANIPFDDVIFEDATADFGRMSLYGVYMLMLWIFIRYLFQYKVVERS